MRRRLLLWLVPTLLAGTAALASPLPAMAAAEIVETATTTYKVVPTTSEIDVTIELAIKNNKPPAVISCGWHCTQAITYYWDTTLVSIETQAGPVKTTSNAGSVTGTVTSAGKYYRTIKLIYPPVYYGQSRKITVTYAIPAGLHAEGGYRAGQAYANLCAVGNGVDSGTLNVILPDGFDVGFYAGEDLTQSSDAGGLQSYTSGPITEPYKHWTCLDASNPANLATTTLTAGGQTFSVQSWPEDPTWATAIKSDVQSDVAGLEALTGLKMPGGTILIREAGNSQLGEYIGMYNSSTQTAFVTEETDKVTVAHELSHIWFNGNLFADKWMSEGFAGYSEKVAGTGNYTPCKEPGAYPGSGSPNLTDWMLLDINSTLQDENVLQYEYSAACYIVTDLAGAMGPANFKSVLVAAANDEIAYVGAGPAEKSPAGAAPISARALVDLIDERGIIPAGVKDLDQAQALLGRYGIFGATELAARSNARAAYHKLQTAAKGWKLPLAVRSPLATWDFAQAQTAMDAAAQIVTLRDEMAKNLSGFTLDGTAIQKSFEGAKTQADLDALLAITKKEADAGGKVAQARNLNDGGHSIFQTIGLIGIDTQTPLNQANDALENVKPDDASATAQKVIDSINGSNDQGLMRLGGLIGVPLALLAVVLFVRWRRRRQTVVAMVPAEGALNATVVSPPGDDAASWAAAFPAWVGLAPTAVVTPADGAPPAAVPPVDPAPPSGDIDPTS